MLAVGAGEIIPGGIVNGITGTLFMVLLASLIAIPIGLLVGIFLYDQQSKRYAAVVRDITDILQGVPSIVLGLIAYFWVVKNITNGFSALAGSRYPSTKHQDRIPLTKHSEKNNENRIRFSFVVDRFGDLRKVQIKNQENTEYGKELYHLLYSTAEHWKAGKVKGKSVDTLFELEFIF